MFPTHWALDESQQPFVLSAWRLVQQGLSERELTSRLGLKAATRAPARDTRSGSVIQVIPIHGAIENRGLGLMGLLFGGTTCQGIIEAVNTARDDSRIDAIVLDVDSPGGIVDGVPEAADAVYRAAQQKPVIASVNATAASAAYWIASQATELIVTTSGQVGSIGVFVLHLDASGALDQAGIVPTFITSSPRKIEGNPYQPLSTDARNETQRVVDHYYGMFVDAVARGRHVPAKTVRDTFGGGRMVEAPRAVQLGMADRVGTFESAVGRGATMALKASADFEKRADALIAQWEREEYEQTFLTEWEQIEARAARMR